MEVIDLRTDESAYEASTRTIFDVHDGSPRFIFANFYIENQRKIVFTDHGSVFVCSIETNSMLREINAHTLTIPFFYVFNRDKNLLTIGSGNEIKDVAHDLGELPIKIWDLATGECLHAFGEPLGVRNPDSFKILSTQLSEDETILFTLTGCGEIKTWDIRSGALIDAFRIPGSGWFSQICVSEHNRIIIYSADGNHSLSIMDLHTHQIITNFVSELTFDQIECSSDGFDIIANGRGILNFLSLENFQ